MNEKQRLILEKLNWREATVAIEQTFYIGLEEPRIISVTHDIRAAGMTLVGEEEFWLRTFVVHQGNRLDDSVTNIYEIVPSAIPGMLFTLLDVTEKMMGKVKEEMAKQSTRAVE